MSRRAARGPRRKWMPDREVVAGCAFTAVTATLCAALLAAAALVPAPATVLPVVALVCIGSPMFAVWDLSRRIAALRAVDASAVDVEPALDRRAIADLRRALARLPETRHPLGL
jgi:hypothetical protein